MGLALTIIGCGGVDFTPDIDRAAASSGSSGASGSGGGGPVPAAVRGELTALITALKHPASLATYGGKVYVADSEGASVYAVDEHGEELFRVDGPRPQTIAANSSGVYWGAFGDGTSGELQLNRANLDGSDVTTLTDGFVPSAIALGPDGVYGTGSKFSAAGGMVMMGLAGGPVVTLTRDSGLSYGVAVDADNLYWMESSFSLSIRSVALAATSPSDALPPKGNSKLLATDSDDGRGLAIDAHNVYWVNDRGDVKKVPLDGGEPTLLASGTRCASDRGCIAVDGTNVYWATKDSILKVSVDGGTPEVLARGLIAPRHLALDDSSVYWADSGSSTTRGVIFRLTPK